MIEASFISVVLILSGLNVFQFLFWSRQTQKLVDKLMSRNYADYVQTNVSASPLPSKQNTKEPEFLDEDLDNLNKIMAGV